MTHLLLKSAALLKKVTHKTNGDSVQPHLELASEIPVLAYLNTNKASLNKEGLQAFVSVFEPSKSCEMVGLYQRCCNVNEKLSAFMKIKQQNLETNRYFEERTGTKIPQQPQSFSTTLAVFTVQTGMKR